MERSLVTVEGWTLHEYADVSSTSDLAATLPPWHAVRADHQQRGRGRWRRPWVSDVGGLWITAVLPTGPDLKPWRVFPLAVGLAVVDFVRSVGVANVRLRWPNDLMVGNRKLAGLLLEEPRPGLVLAGIGINITNQPETADAALHGITTRLTDHVQQARIAHHQLQLDAPRSRRGMATDNSAIRNPQSAISGFRLLTSTATKVGDQCQPLPDLTTLACSLLLHLRKTRDAIADTGFAPLLPRLQELWQLPRSVELDFGKEKIQGEFCGVDEQGRLGLRHGATCQWFEAAHVVQLREI
ncbi:MAG: biotin--[acetyl-CoA-carboxylase] ligase [Verrucomicrobiota bacterium]